MSSGLGHDSRILVLEERVENLTIQVEDLARAVEQLSIALRRSQSSDFQVVSSVASAASDLSGISLPRSSGSHGGYNDLAEEIPVVPEAAKRLCALLSGGTLSGAERAQRAWESGYWARFCLQGRVSKPRPSRPIDLSNTCYVVLRATGYNCPLRVAKAADYRHIINDFKDGSISHGFASQAEAKVYCEAAGVIYPAGWHQWSNLQ